MGAAGAVDARLRRRPFARCGARGKRRRRSTIKSQHYTINLMVPLFTPPPIEHPDIPIHLGRGEPVHVPGRGRGGQRRASASRLHTEVHRGGHAAGRAQGRGEGGALARWFPGRHQAIDRDGARRQSLASKSARRSRTRRLLRVDAGVPRLLRGAWPRRSRHQAAVVFDGAALGGDAGISSPTRCCTPMRRSAPTTRSPTSCKPATATSSPMPSSRSPSIRRTRKSKLSAMVKRLQSG